MMLMESAIDHAHHWSDLTEVWGQMPAEMRLKAAELFMGALDARLSILGRASKRECERMLKNALRFANGVTTEPMDGGI